MEGVVAEVALVIDDDRSSLGVVPEFHFQTTLLDHPYLQPVLAHSVLAKCCPQHGAVPQRLDLLVIAPPFWAENTAPTSTKRRKVVTLGWVLSSNARRGVSHKKRNAAVRCIPEKRAQRGDDMVETQKRQTQGGNTHTHTPRR